MRPFLLAFALALHALAHAGAGMWASAQAPWWLVMPLWMVSMGGFLLAAFAIAGVERFRTLAAPLTIGATVASAALLRLAGIGAWSLVGLAIGVAFCGMVRWWVRCTHPEIHTPTIATPGVPPLADAPSLGERLVAIVAYAMVGLTVALIAVRPWHQQWGTTAEERAVRIPGESDDAPTIYRIDHGITIKAPAARVWAWVAQLGQDRAGFYSYDALERAFGDQVRNADTLVAEWQRRHEGDLVRAAQPDFGGGRLGSELGWRITQWDPPRSMTLANWGTFVVRPLSDSTSRLLVQTHGSGRPSLRALAPAVFGFYAFEPVHFIMQRGMLQGIKARAERTPHGARQ